MKRRLAWILVITLLIGIFPVQVFAAQKEESQVQGVASAEMHLTYAEGLWTSYAADAFAGGTGTSDDPILIANAEQLARFADLVNKSSLIYVYVELIANIDLYGHYWVPIGSRYNAQGFQGVFKGNGYTIYGMTIDETCSTNLQYGLFGYTGGTISDFHMQSVEIWFSEDVSSCSVGAVAGYNAGSIENIDVQGSLFARSSRQVKCGGIVGSSYGTVQNCSFSGVSQGWGVDRADIGGIIGSANSKPTNNNYSTGTASGYASGENAYVNVGGHSGYQSSAMANCYSEMNVNAKGVQPRAGGLIGVGTAEVRNAYATGKVSATVMDSDGWIVPRDAAGGIMGYWNLGSIQGCFTQSSLVSSKLDGDFSAVETSAGRLVGYTSGSSDRGTATAVYANTSTTIERTKVTKNEGCDGSISYDYSITNEPSNTLTNEAPFTYSKSFLQNTLGWKLYTNLSALAASPDSVWIYRDSAPALYTQERCSLTIRYRNVEGDVFDVYFAYYDKNAEYSVVSPTMAGERPEKEVVSGVITQDTYVEVSYIHEHIPGPLPTCTSDQLCTLCGAIVAERIPHPYVVTEMVYPTCEENGYNVYTCHMCGDTYHADYVSPTGHQLNDSSVCIVCGKEFSEELRNFTIYVYDMETGKPVADATVQLGDKTILTDSEGAALFQLTDDSPAKLTVTAQGYPDKVLENFISGDMPSTYIMLESDETGIHEAWCNGDNVFVTDSQINALSPALEARIVVAGRAKANILRYELVQDGKVIAASTDGKFCVKNPYFKQGSDVYVYMHTDGQDGHNLFKRKTNIKVAGFTLDADTDWGKLLPFSGGFDMKFSNGTPLLDGINFKLPAYIGGKNAGIKTVVGNEKVMVSYTNKKDFLDSGKDLDNKTRKQILKEMRDDWIEQNNPKAWPKGDPTREVTYSVGIVFEFEGKTVTSVYGQINLGYELSYEYGKTFLVWIVPIYASVQAGIEGELELTELGYDFENAEILIPDLDINIKGGVTLMGGLGCSAISAGVYGSGGLDINLGMVDWQGYFRYKLYGELGLYARIKLFFWKAMEYKLPLLYGDFYGPNGTMAVDLSLLSLEDYETVARDYLYKRSDWLSTSLYSDAGDAHGILQTSSYYAIEPKIVQSGNTTMMVFMDDDGSEGLNYQHLYYSLFDPATSSWGVPVRVDSSDCADLEFDVYADDSGISIAYTKIGAITEDNQEDDLQLMAGVEVYGASFDAAAGTFVGHTNVSGNDCFDTQPQIVTAGGKTAVVWISNPTNDALAQNANNVLMQAVCEQGAWQKAQELTERGATVVSMDAGMLGGKACTAMVLDVDCDLATLDDRIVRIVDQSGTVTDVETDTNGNGSVQFTSVGGTDVLQWYNGGNIYQLKAAGAKPAALFETPVDGLTAEFAQLTIDDSRSVILFVKNGLDEEGGVSGSAVYAVYYSDGQWGEPVALTEAMPQLYVDAFDGCIYDGKLLLSYILTEATVGESDIVRTSNFMTSQIVMRDDLAVGEAVYLPSQLFEGDQIEVRVPVTNGSWQTLTGLKLQLLDPQGTVVVEKATSLSGEDALVSGETDYIGFLLPKEKLTPGVQYRIHVSTSRWTEADMSNNTVPLSLWYTDLEVAAEQILIGGKLQLHYVVNNAGNTAGGGTLRIYKKNADDTETNLLNKHIESLAPGEQLSEKIEITDQFYPAGEQSGIVYVTVEPELPEQYTFNNSTGVNVGSLDTGKTEDITGTAEAPAAPVVMDPYVVYDKKTGGSLSAAVTENGWSFTTVSGLAAENYSYSGASLLLKEQYLQNLSLGYHYFTLCYSLNGVSTEATLILEVTDSSFPVPELTVQDQSVKYDGKAVELSELVYETNSGGAVTAAYSTDGGSSWTAGLPVQIGQYTVRLSLAEDAESGYAPTEGIFRLTITKGTRAISMPTNIRAVDGRIRFDGAIPTVEPQDGEVSYGYSTVNDPAAVGEWNQSGELPQVNSAAVYYIFARITGSDNFEDAYSVGYAVQAHVHQYAKVEATEPTCLTEGNYAYSVCSCGIVLKADGVTETTVEAETIAPLGHDWADATCTEARLCRRPGCGAEEGAALGHDWKEQKTDSAHLKDQATNCTQFNTYWYDCARCETVSDTAYFTSTIAGPHSFTQRIEDDAHFVAGSGVNCQDAKVYYFDCAYCDRMGTDTFVSEKTGDHQVSDQWTSAEGKHFHSCTVEGCDYSQDAENCSGGTATCLEKAVCGVCSREYGELADHTLIHHTRQEADHYEPGYIEHWICDVCGRYFADASASTEITPEDTVLNVVPHDHGTEWAYDENLHWNQCECGDKTNVFAHNYDHDCDADCNTCGYVRSIAHSWSAEFAYSLTQHWIECGICGEKKDAEDHHGGTADCLHVAVCQDCGQEYGTLGGHEMEHYVRQEPDHFQPGNIEFWYCRICGKYFSDVAGEQEISREETVLAVIPHSYGSEFEKDESQHWHSCSCGDKTDVENHIYKHSCDTTCDTCGYVRTIEHSWESGLTHDETHHWVSCAVCGETKDMQPHTGGTATCTDQAVCEACNRAYGETDAAHHTVKVQWSHNETCHSGVYPCCGAAAAENEPHTFADGVCTVCTYALPAAKIGDVTYSTLDKALAAARAGDTVTLLMDQTVESVVLAKGIRLDLNGFTLTARYFVAFIGNKAVDSVGTGLLRCGNVRLEKNNGQMPVWVEAEGGYRFFEMKSQQKYRTQTADYFEFIAKPILVGDETDVLMAQSDTNGLSIKVRLNWISNSGKAVEQFFILNAEDMRAIYSQSSKVIQLNVNGSGAYVGKLSTTCYMESETGVVWAPDGRLYVGK